MNLKTALFLALLAVPLLTSAARAQEQAHTAPAEDVEKSTERESVATSPRTDEATESPSDAAASTESSPYEYEASEQISEDRSVSFPVDI